MSGAVGEVREAGPGGKLGSPERVLRRSRKALSGAVWGMD